LGFEIVFKGRWGRLIWISDELSAIFLIKIALPQSVFKISASLLHA
jgi:hypothetical protein